MNIHLRKFSNKTRYFSFRLRKLPENDWQEFASELPNILHYRSGTDGCLPQVPGRWFFYISYRPRILNPPAVASATDRSHARNPFCHFAMRTAVFDDIT